MRDIDMERVNGTREKMLETVKSPVLTHEQKVAAMANLADALVPWSLGGTGSSGRAS